MKKLLLTLIFILITSNILYAGDIILTNPVNVSPQATKIMTHSWTVNPDSIAVNLYWKELNGNIIKHEVFIIENENFTDLNDAIIQPSHVGKKFISVIEMGIRNKIKSMKTLDGTVN